MFVVLPGEVGYDARLPRLPVVPFCHGVVSRPIRCHPVDTLAQGLASHSRRGVAETLLDEASPHVLAYHSQPMPVTVRLLASSEWPLWRDVSLQSLAESPDAFRPTLAEAEDRPEEFWRGTVVPNVEHERVTLWIAVNGDEPVGKLFAQIDEELTTVYIGGMWVAPDLRGAGVGRRLVQAAEEWGKESGVTRSELWVTEANQVAVHFYESLDYLPTDATQMLREGSELVVRKLQKKI